MKDRRPLIVYQDPDADLDYTIDCKKALNGSGIKIADVLCSNPNVVGQGDRSATHDKDSLTFRILNLSKNEKVTVRVTSDDNPPKILNDMTIHFQSSET